MTENVNLTHDQVMGLIDEQLQRINDLVQTCDKDDTPQPAPSIKLWGRVKAFLAKHRLVHK